MGFGLQGFLLGYDVLVIFKLGLTHLALDHIIMHSDTISLD